MSNRKTYGETLIINEELFKLYSQVSRNVGVDKVFPFLQLSQPYHIEPILGTPLLTELQYQVENNTLTEANKALIVKIAPCLSAWTDYIAARSLAYTVSARGIVKDHSENSEALNEKELGYYIHTLRELAEQSQEMLVRYLCRCQENFPLWKPDKECDCAKYMPTDGSAETDIKHLIYFPNGKRDGCPHCDRN